MFPDASFKIAFWLSLYFQADLRSSAITCGHGLLQYESHAIANSFSCLDRCEGDKCPLTCEENYYIVGDNNAICKNNNSVGRWVVKDDFECKRKSYI